MLCVLSWLVWAVSDQQASYPGHRGSHRNYHICYFYSLNFFIHPGLLVNTVIRYHSLHDKLAQNSPKSALFFCECLCYVCSVHGKISCAYSLCVRRPCACLTLLMAASCRCMSMSKSQPCCRAEQCEQCDCQIWSQWGLGLCGGAAAVAAMGQRNPCLFSHWRAAWKRQ